VDAAHPPHADHARIRTPIYGKADFFNPGGSVKDRIGLPIIEQAEREGRLRPGGTIVEGTSGNTGVGLAIAAALKGYKCIFTMPDKMSQEKVRLLKAFGAEVIITPTAVAADHPDNYVMMAKRIAAETPNAILADQFYNQTNPEAHYATTGPELWEQTEGRITHFVAAAGTGGTITGVGRYLKERNPKIKIIAGDPQGSILAELWRSKGAHRPDGAPYKVEGIGQDKLPGTLDLAIIDDYRTVSDRDAFAMTRRLTREEGLFVGGSAGLITHVALQVAREVDDAEALIVTFLCDTGERYLSKVFNDEWMRENQLLEPDRVTLGDLLQHKGDAAPSTLVSAAPGQLVRQALGLMRLHDVSQLPCWRTGVRRQRDGVRTHAAGPRELTIPGRGRRRGDGRSVSRRGRGAARGVGPEAAFQSDSRRTGAPSRDDRRDRDAERHARVSDVEMSADCALRSSEPLKLTDQCESRY
jgi:cystathionine beta-synthase